jgi:hypothetical protein
MARGKKEYEVDKIKHVSGLVVPILFNPNARSGDFHTIGLTFSAAVGDRNFRADSCSKVKDEVMEFLNKNSKLDWYPVIEITEISPFNNHGAFVGLESHRFYLANTEDQPQHERGARRRLRKLRWDDYDPTKQNWMTMNDYKEIGIDLGRIKHSTEFYDVQGILPGCLPQKSEGRTETHYLPYDEVTWTALLAIEDGIHRLKKYFRELLGTPQGQAQLNLMGANLLKLLPPATPVK